MSFNPSGGNLSGATDVAMVSPATGKFLTYNGGIAKWQDSTMTGFAALPTGGGVETLSALGNKTGATTLNLANGNVFSATMTGNITFTFSGSTASTACSFSLYLTQDATGSRTVTWPASVKWAGGTTPTLSTAGTSIDVLVFETLNGGTVWYGSLVGLAFS